VRWGEPEGVQLSKFPEVGVDGAAGEVGTSYSSLEAMEVSRGFKRHKSPKK